MMVDLRWELPGGAERRARVYVPDDMIIFQLWGYLQMQLGRGGHVRSDVPVILLEVEGEPLRRRW